MDNENCFEHKQRAVPTSNGGVYQNGDQSKWADASYKEVESVSSSPPSSSQQEDEEEKTGNEEGEKIWDQGRGLGEEQPTISAKDGADDYNFHKPLWKTESEACVSLPLAEILPDNSNFIQVEGLVCASNDLLKNPTEGSNMQSIGNEKSEILAENGDELYCKSLSDGTENHAQGDNTIAAVVDSNGTTGHLVNKKNKSDSGKPGNSDRETSSTNLALLEIKESFVEPSPEPHVRETFDPLSVHLEINGLKADCISNPPCNSINVSELPTVTRQEALDSTSSCPNPQIYRPVSLSNVSTLNSVNLNGDDPSSGDMSTLAIEEHETPASDTGKVVTFAEDKEIFDMAYNQPACITVHLDTPVSCIAPDDVLLEVIQPPVEPPTATQQPMSGILKTDTDEINPAVLDVSEGFGDAREGTLSKEHDDFNNDPLLGTASNTQSQDPAVMLHSDRDALDMHGKSTLLPLSDLLVENNKDLEGDKALDKEVEGNEVSDQEEDDEQGKRREFIVETVAEPEVLFESDVSVDRFFPGKVDGGSHSTDSNYQDTIGPLDNPQFLKTLNYTASQAFDQDEHFGLQSNGPDTRSLALANLLDPPDLDGGWAWVVLIASFVAATLLGASVYASGKYGSANYPCTHLSK